MSPEYLTHGRLSFKDLLNPSIPAFDELEKDVTIGMLSKSCDPYSLSPVAGTGEINHVNVQNKDIIMLNNSQDTRLPSIQNLFTTLDSKTSAIAYDSSMPRAILRNRVSNLLFANQSKLPVRPSLEDPSTTIYHSPYGNIKPSSSGSHTFNPKEVIIVPLGPIPDTSDSLRRCANCGTRETPSWRRCGPEQTILCNACGLYYNEHKRPRQFRTNPDGRTKAIRSLKFNLVEEGYCPECTAQSPEKGLYCETCLYIPRRNAMDH